MRIYVLKEMDECKVGRARDIYTYVMRRFCLSSTARHQFPETIIFPVMFRIFGPKHRFGSIFTAAHSGQNNIWAVKLHLTRQHYTASHPERNSSIASLLGFQLRFSFSFFRKSSNTITSSVLYINLVYRSKNYHSTHNE